MTHKPTENGEAYLAFVQAHNLFAPDDLEKLKQAEQLFRARAAIARSEFCPGRGPAFASGELDLSYLRSIGRAPEEGARAGGSGARICNPICRKGISRWLIVLLRRSRLRARAGEFTIAQSGLPNDAGVPISLWGNPAAPGQMDRIDRQPRESGRREPERCLGPAKSRINYQRLAKFRAAEEFSIADRLDSQLLSLRRCRSAVGFEGKGPECGAE